MSPGSNHRQPDPLRVPGDPPDPTGPAKHGLDRHHLTWLQPHTRQQPTILPNRQRHLAATCSNRFNHEQVPTECWLFDPGECDRIEQHLALRPSENRKRERCPHRSYEQRNHQPRPASSTASTRHVEPSTERWHQAGRRRVDGYSRRAQQRSSTADHNR
jgi:hypothetical protein